ncbi:MAG: 6,7-dimethyl-8-ribityllumazine synthase [Gemmatimonadetes bacterium]|nr:6,7-dimethyl-8-ribityllumazine synthase [Gemmatimonadota bacterium]
MTTGSREPRGEGRRFAIVVARFNDFVTARLARAAVATLHEHGVAEADVEEIAVPGAFELPLAARRVAASGRFHAVICLGAVIRGETPHFDFVAAECARGVADAGRDLGLPVIFGVLTTDNPEQAMDRAGGAAGNKGRDSALAALEMAELLARWPEGAR